MRGVKMYLIHLWIATYFILWGMLCLAYFNEEVKDYLLLIAIGLGFSFALGMLSLTYL